MLVPAIPPPPHTHTTRYDLFADEDSAKRKVLIGALRYYAHTNGASLHCYSRRDKVLQLHYRALMNHHAFRTPAKKSNQLDSTKAVVIPAGSDSMRKTVNTDKQPINTSKQPINTGGERFHA